MPAPAGIGGGIPECPDDRAVGNEPLSRDEADANDPIGGTGGASIIPRCCCEGFEEDGKEEPLTMLADSPFLVRTVCAEALLLGILDCDLRTVSRTGPQARQLGSLHLR